MARRTRAVSLYDIRYANAETVCARDAKGRAEVTRRSLLNLISNVRQSARYDGAIESRAMAASDLCTFVKEARFEDAQHDARKSEGRSAFRLTVCSQLPFRTKRVCRRSRIPVRLKCSHINIVPRENFIAHSDIKEERPITLKSIREPVLSIQFSFSFFSFIFARINSIINNNFSYVIMSFDLIFESVRHFGHGRVCDLLTVFHVLLLHKAVPI